MVSLTLFRLAAGTALALCLVFTGCVDGVKVTNSESRTNWTLRQSPAEYDLYNVIWNGSEFRAVGFDGTMISSPDGISWKAFEHPEIFGSWPGISPGRTSCLCTSSPGREHAQDVAGWG